jgi:hypothetical protein
MAFAKLKSHLRREAARTLETLQPAVARSLACFLPVHCQNFFRHAEYGTISIENALAPSEKVPHPKDYHTRAQWPVFTPFNRIPIAQATYSSNCYR